MAKTLLNGVNEILKRASIIAGDAGLLTSLTDSGRQVHIDQAVQVINEGIEELYSATNTPQPSEQKEATITLLTNTRDYTLAGDLIQLRFPLIDKTNLQYIHDFPGGYNAILQWDPGQTFTGLPHLAAIRPTDGKLYMDRTPASADNGKVYTYQYDKNLALSVYTDTVPFSDAVFRAMVPAWVQLWKRESRNEFDEPLFKMNIGRAARLASQKQARSDWSPR